jgi:hypothetical protein
MKKTVLLLSGLLLSAFVSGPAAAEVVRVRVTARVTTLDDPNGRLAGKVIVGQRITGTYVYNTNTPNRSPHPDLSGEYLPFANEARVRFVVGGLAFESQQPTQSIRISIQSHTSNVGYFGIVSADNKALADGTAIDYILIDFRGAGSVTESTALPNVAPTLNPGPVFPFYFQRRLEIRASSTLGGYNIIGDIEAAELIEAEAIVVSPASGTFAANQHFDASVILPRNTGIFTAQATSNGVTLPLSYPGNCFAQGQVGTGRPSLLCPGADAVLSTIQPGASIVWTVQLLNGTTHTETVTWERAP